jgi:hypothetical protein
MTLTCIALSRDDEIIALEFIKSIEEDAQESVDVLAPSVTVVCMHTIPRVGVPYIDWLVQEKDRRAIVPAVWIPGRAVDGRATGDFPFAFWN